MKYCANCLLPETKPYISFDEQGVCSACQAHKKKQDVVNGIDWAKHESEFEKIVLDAKGRNAPFYDALVPVSGGKDSITQVHRLLKYDLRILAVNVDYGIKTEIGHHNLECVAQMGANLMIYRPELSLHTKLIRIGLEDYGDPDLLSHTMLHAFPLHMALRFEIPLVCLGENSAFEYGGDKKIAGQTSMTREWFTKFAANSGNDAKKISKKYNISFDKLKFYDFPDEIENSEIKTAFLSQYFFWDSEKHLEIAQKYGFKTLDHPGEGTYRDYVGIDEKINRIHQYFKVLKFGYGRATDHACEDIRNGRLSRDEAKNLVKNHDLTPLSDYYVDDFIQFIGIKKETFFQILESYRNREIWKKDNSGKYSIQGYLEGF